MFAFVVTAINSQREIKKCGAKLLPKPHTLLAPTRAAVMGGVAEFRFPLRLCATVLPGPCWEGSPAELTMAAVQVDVSWDRVAMRTFEALRFLGSDPAPCDVDRPGARLLNAWHAVAPPIASHPTAKNDWGLLTAEERAEDTFLRERAEGLTRLALRSRERYTVPVTFDFRQHWPACVQPPRTQGLCVSSWAMAAAGAFEKQVCALSTNMTEKVRLSAQFILDCAPHSSGCSGGRVADVFELLYNEGVVPEECLPYTEPKGPDSIANYNDTSGEAPQAVAAEAASFNTPPGYRVREEGQETQPCQALRTKLASLPEEKCPRYRARGPTADEAKLAALPRYPPAGMGIVRGVAMMQAAILAYGAVVSMVEVYADFLDYDHNDGTYIRAHVLTDHDCLGLMAVQLMGWGVEHLVNDIQRPYWIGEGSFGKLWGKDGYFHWLRGEDHLGIEGRALHPFVDGKFPAGLQATAASAGGGGGYSLGKDRLSVLEEHVVLGENHIQHLRSSQRWLLAGNAFGFFISAVLISVAFCVNQSSRNLQSVERDGLESGRGSSYIRHKGSMGYAAVPAEDQDGL
eukprot:gnl/TRDRNA2_/TRDRNA2_155559_c0_seq1.p1 gnl/TRDRNA2_/TRDRNA2_155559_c0~~gnl/TRDRNA2_/TRDRNA2_155559_c0_seq1.p1  ORF type:complete len:672 (+),score=82.71 gnl/TRDRNA2_/TRDRNA2_155559_c0_seq1:303-2018(+)